MPSEYLDRTFAALLAQPVAGDTALMDAIRKCERERAICLLESGDVDVAAANAKQETALYLALRSGQFDLVERLHALGAPDSTIQTSDNFKDTPPLDWNGAPITADNIDRFFDVFRQSRAITHANLLRVRAALTEYVEQNYPRSRWLESLPAEQQTRAATIGSVLKQTGVADIGQALDTHQIQEIRDALEGRPCYASHVMQASDRTPRSLAETLSHGKFACYHLTDALTLPHLWAFANSPSVLKIIADYLGCVPTLYGTNVLWSAPPTDQLAMCDLQHAHRDFDYYHFVTLFIYLTDVDEGRGPHRYYKGTHDLDRTREILERRFSHPVASLVANDLFRSIDDCYGRTGMVEELFADESHDVMGPAGTAFLVDTHGLHRGSIPNSGPRLMAWFRFGTTVPTPAAFKLGEDPSDSLYRKLGFPEFDRYINRIMFRDLAAENQPRGLAAGRTNLSVAR